MLSNSCKRPRFWRPRVAAPRVDYPGRPRGLSSPVGNPSNRGQEAVSRRSRNTACNFSSRWRPDDIPFHYLKLAGPIRRIHCAARLAELQRWISAEEDGTDGRTAIFVWYPSPRETQAASADASARENERARAADSILLDGRCPKLLIEVPPMSGARWMADGSWRWMPNTHVLASRLLRHAVQKRMAEKRRSDGRVASRYAR